MAENKEKIFPEQCAPINILLVDDTEADIKITLRAFEKARLRNNIFVVHDGLDALDFLHHRRDFTDIQKFPRPGIILLDINMPKMDGFEVLKAVKEDPAIKSIPVVMLTSSKDHQDILKSYNYGASSYIPKPVNYEEFLRVVESFNFYWSIVNRLPPDDAEGKRANGVDVRQKSDLLLDPSSRVAADTPGSNDAILIVDDNLADQKMLERIFKQLGYPNLFFAETGEDALQAATDILPRFMLVDTRLPGISGFDVCRSVKKTLKNHVKVIIMTGLIESIDAKEARESGADAYCAKTRDCAHLVAAFKKLVKEDAD